MKVKTRVRSGGEWPPLPPLMVLDKDKMKAG